MKKWILGSAALAMVATCAVAQRGQRLSPECRQEFVKLCGATRDRQAILKCLRGTMQSFSDRCRAEINERMKAARSQWGENATGGTEYSYGSDAKQAFDFWPVSGNTKAPLVVFIHGGGWSIGDKRSGAGGKPEYYNSLGHAFASVNYRLVPHVTPAEQASDVAASIAWMRKNADKLGFDANRIFVMGHSAGAHLAALVSTDTRYLTEVGVPLTAMRGTILLDGAGYDVVKQMTYKGNRVQGMYDAAFTKDPATQARLAPVTHAGLPDVARWLILPVESRPDALDQSRLLARALETGGVKATVKPVPDATHASVNKDSGVAGSFVGEAIAGFLKG